MADDLDRSMGRPRALQDTVGMRAQDMQQVRSSIRTLSDWTMAQIYSLPMLSSAARDSVGESPSPAGVRALVIRVMGYIFSYAIVWGRVDADRARAARVQLRVSVGRTIFRRHR